MAASIQVESVVKFIKTGDLSNLKQLITNNNETLNMIQQYCHRKTGDHALSYACRQGNLEILKFLHINCSLNLELGNFEGKRPLHEAAQSGNEFILQYLLEWNVCVDSLKRADWTPLMLACTKTNLPVIMALVEAGADLNLENKDGWNSFHLACREGDLNIVKYLHQKNLNIWNTTSKNGRTPLHTAALHGRDTTVEYLIENCGYITDMKDSCGSTPFMDAIRAGYTSTAHILFRKHCANLSARDNLGRHPIHLAAETGNEASLLYLVNTHHISINVQADDNLVTPLHLACKEGHWEIVRLLCELDADMNMTDYKGRLALHIACGSQQTRCVEILLQNGAVDCEDTSKNTARELVKKPEIMELFVKFGQG